MRRSLRDRGDAFPLKVHIFPNRWSGKVGEVRKVWRAHDGSSGHESPQNSSDDMPARRHRDMSDQGEIFFADVHTAVGKSTADRDQPQDLERTLRELGTMGVGP